MSIRDDLKAYVDGELPPARQVEVEAALAADPELNREALFLKELAREIRALAPEFESSGREAAARRVRLEARPDPGPGRVWLRRLAFGTGFVFALIGFAAVGAGLLNTIGNRGLDHAAGAYPAAEGPGRGIPETESDAGAAQMMAPAEFDLRKSADGLGGPPAPAGMPGDRPDSVAPDVGGRASGLVVKNGEIRLRVESARSALERANAIATGAGGFVQRSSLSGMEGGLPTATITMRVPASRFEATMTRLGELGQVVSVDVTGEDVTKQVADIDARIKVLRAEEESYISMLRAATKVGELLEIRERLGAVRQEVESMTAVVKALRDQASLSTITAALEQRVAVGEPQPDRDWASRVWASAVNGLVLVLRGLASVAIFVAVFAPIWVPVGLAVWWWRRRRTS
ncbi:MAG: DUF4349 domain-containing protein [Fimbriimonadaceae bacterium]